MIEAMTFQLLLATFAGWGGREQSHVIAYLIEENRFLKEQLESGARRLRFTVLVQRFSGFGGHRQLLADTCVR
jgi:hypothetical protein